MSSSGGALRFSDEPDPAVWPQRFSPISDPGYVHLRDRFGLTGIVAPDEGALARAVALRTWTHRRWDHGNDVPSRWDPETILEEAESGRQFPCGAYATVLAAVLNAAGIRGRMIELMSWDVETRARDASHVVAEAWLSDWGRWVLLDAQDDYSAELSGAPIGAVGLGLALDRGDPGVRLPGVPDEALPEAKRAGTRYYHFFRTWRDNRAGAFDPLGESVILTPLGESPPRAFQGTLSLGRATSTHSALSFDTPPPV